jgi:hypothetical protein
MKGPEMKCPECGGIVVQVKRRSEKKGVYFETMCFYCGWKES